MPRAAAAGPPRRSLRTCSRTPLERFFRCRRVATEELGTLAAAPTPAAGTGGRSAELSGIRRPLARSLADDGTERDLDGGAAVASGRGGRTSGLAGATSSGTSTGPGSSISSPNSRSSSTAVRRDLDGGGSSSGCSEDLCRHCFSGGEGFRAFLFRLLSKAPAIARNNHPARMMKKAMTSTYSTFVVRFSAYGR